MPDYQTMYHLLFNRITDAVAALQEAQQLAEELYLNADEPVYLLPNSSRNE